MLNATASSRTLFSTKLVSVDQKAEGDLYYWNGDLSVPNGLNIAGLWFDTRTLVRHAAGVLGPLRRRLGAPCGGAAAASATICRPTSRAELLPRRHRQRDSTIFRSPARTSPTATVGPDRARHRRCHAEREPDLPAGPRMPIATAPPASTTPGELLSCVATLPARATPPATAGERSLDVGVVAIVRTRAARSASMPARALPRSSHANDFTVLPDRVLGHGQQSRGPVVVVLDLPSRPTPGSLFYNAVKELFIDRRLRNITDGAGQQRLRLGLERRDRPCQPGASTPARPSCCWSAARRSRRWRGSFRSDDRQRPSRRQSLYGLAMARRPRRPSGGSLKAAWHTPCRHARARGARRLNDLPRSGVELLRSSNGLAHAEARRERRRRRHHAADALVPDRPSASTPTSVQSRASPPAAARRTSRPIPAATCST